MELIYRARRQGKTTSCLAWFMADPQHRKIVTSSEQRAEVVRDALRANLVRAFGEEYGAKLGLELDLDKKVLRYGDFKGHGMDDVMVDDADELLRQLISDAGASLAGATWTEDGVREQINVPVMEPPAAHWTPPEGDPEGIQSASLSIFDDPDGVEIVPAHEKVAEFASAVGKAARPDALESDEA